MTGWPSYALRRLLVASGLLFALATTTFWVNQAIPYDAGYYLLRNVNNPTREQVEQANERLGVDRPALEQYGSFLSGLVRGDLGVSWETASYDPEEGVVGDAVMPMVLRSAAVTGSLVLGGVALLLLLAMPTGPFLAARAGSAADRSILLVTLVFVSTHPLVTGLVLQLIFGRRLGWLPDSGYCPLLTTAPEPGFGTDGATCGGPLDWATHLVLPWLSFALLFLALYLRQIRTQSLAVLQEPFVTVARAKGATERRVLLRHVVPGVSVVVVTMVAMDVGTALGIALFVEVVYGLPGLGRLLIVAVQGFVGFDRPVIVGIVLASGAAVIVVTFVADVLAAAIDPRVRSATGGRGVGAER
jgi:peptide/nickel transport system permease protein